MTHIHIHDTKKRLAVVFAIIVFFIAFFLELTYFSLKYYNISYNDKKDFQETTNQITSQILVNPYFLKIFLTEGIQFTPDMHNNLRKGRGGPERGFRFLNFLVVGKNGEVLAQNFTQDIDIEREDINIEYNRVVKMSEGILAKKVNIENVGGDFKDLIFIKIQGYDFFNYLEDILFFLIVNGFFSIIFYFVGLFFVGKNLQPIEQTLSDMNDFIHNANHELKTPIAVISSNLQMMKATQNYEEDLVLDSMKEIKRIDELIVGLSDLSDISSISHLENLDIKVEIQEIIEELKYELSAKNISLDFQVFKAVSIKANKQYFYIMFSNLLRNAIKYNIMNGYIRIILDKNQISIANSGEGISKEDIPFVFDRFFKGEKSRTTSGVGIGLSLVKKICDIYKWKITLTSQQNKETLFLINL